MNHEIFPVLYDLALFWSPIVSGAEQPMGKSFTLMRSLEFLTHKNDCGDDASFGFGGDVWN